MNIKQITPLAVLVCLCCACQPAEKRKVTVEATGSTALVTAWEQRGNNWKKVFSTPDGFVGQNGVISAADKKEGDRFTPDGVYELRRAFGMVENPDTLLEYRQIVPGDVWVDDPESSYYNQYVPVSSDIKRAWNSAEELSVLDGAYKYAIVVEYNTTPVVPGKGSAIFINCSPNRPVKPTAGDIGIPEKYMKKLFKFLRPGDKIEIKKI